MTLPTTIDRVTYQGNGVAIDFATPFKIFAATNLVVTLTEDATGTVTAQVLNTDYTVTGRIGNEAGNAVRFYTPPATGYTVRVQRVLPIVQEADFTSHGNFYPERHETALDYLTALVQGVAVDATNALKLSDDGTVWDAESLRLSNVADGTATQDAVTLGQLEQVAQNLAAGQAAFAPLIWQYTAAGSQFVFSLPGATITRADAYTVTWDGVMQSPNNYVVGTSSSPFVIQFDSIPPAGVTVLIRCIGVAEVLSSANIDASGVVSGVFDAARLGSGTPGDDKVLVGGPSGPTWSATINGPLTVSQLNFTTLNGTADASLITTGIFPPNRLGTGVYGVNTVLHGDGTFRIPAVATTTGFGLSDAVNAPAVFTSLVFTGDIADSAEVDLTVPKVKIFIKDDGGGSGAGTLEGYVDSLTAESFGTQQAYTVLANFSSFIDTPAFYSASTADTVLARVGANLAFQKIPIATFDTTGTANAGAVLHGDGSWSPVTADLGTSVATDPNGGIPTYPGTGLFYRGDSQWSNTITEAFYVTGTAGSEPNLQIGTSLSTVVVDAQSTGGQIPVEWLPPLHVYNAAGVKLSGADAVDRVVINGRAWAVRQRGQGAPMVRLQSTATSGSITLNTNDYGHFITTPTGNVAYTMSDGGADPTTGSYAAESILELVNPGANTITFTNVDWAGGITPTFAASGRNMVRLIKRMGITNWLGTLINSSTAGFTTEDAQDAVGAMIASSTTITLTYSDATPSLTAAVVAGGIGPTQLATNAVETTKIATGAVINSKIAAGTITADRMAASGTRDALHVLSGADTWVPLSAGGGQAAIQFRDEGGNVGSVGAIDVINFVGSGVTASAAGTTLNVSVSGGGSTINWADDGFVVANSITHPTLSFGSGLSCTDIGGGILRVDNTAGGGGGGGGGQAAIQFRDEGSSVGASGAITAFNVVGAGASLSVAGTVATLTIPGGGGGGGSTGVVFNVRDYGATGNGSSDDTAGIQAAITAAAGAGGGIVVLPAGTYIVAAGITVPGKVSVVGAGMSATTIKLKNSAAGTSDILRATGSYVQFADFTLDGNASNNLTNLRSGISFLDDTNNHRCTNVHVMNNRGFGWAFNSCTDMVFDNCRAVGTKKRQGFWFGSLTNRSARITFRDCQAILNDWDGIHVHGDQIEIVGGHWNQNGQDVTDIGTFGACGIYVDPAYPCVDVTVTGAIANDNKESGIQLCGQGMVVANCIARRNWAAGINLNANRGIVTGCYAEGNGLVKSLGPAFWTDPGNAFRFVYTGISSLSSTEIIFTGNRCHDLKGTKTQKWGIAAETSATGTNTDYLRLTGNMLHGNLTADTGIETATNVTVV